MKDSTRKALKDGASGLVTLFVIGTVLVLASTGCAAVAHDTHNHAVKAPPKAVAKQWKPGRRCKLVGKAMTSHVAVYIERNCLNNGVTTVNIVVLNSEPKGKVKGGVAAEHAVQAVTAILGFKPKLAILFYGNNKGKPYFLTVVTGTSASKAVAKR